jgi:hypothetical protein
VPAKVELEDPRALLDRKAASPASTLSLSGVGGSRSMSLASVSSLSGSSGSPTRAPGGSRFSVNHSWELLGFQVNSGTIQPSGPSLVSRRTERVPGSSR